MTRLMVGDFSASQALVKGLQDSHGFTKKLLQAGQVLMLSSSNKDCRGAFR